MLYQRNTNYRKKLNVHEKIIDSIFNAASRKHDGE
jgi:hypothetical protein